MASKTEYLNLHLYSEEDPFTILGEENSLNGNMQIIDDKFNEINSLEKVQIVSSLPFRGEDDAIYLLDTTKEVLEAPIVPDVVYYVAANGIDSSGTGTRENPWKLVRKAIEVANNIYVEGQIVEVRILGGNWSPFELTTPLPKHKFTLLLTQEDNSQPIGSTLVSVLMISGPTIFKNICMQMSSTAGIICLRGYDCTIKEGSSVKGPYQSELAVFDWGSNTSTSQMEHTQSPQIKIEYGIDLVRIGNRDGYDKFSGQIDIVYDAPDGKPIFHLGTSLQSNNLITTTTTYAPINITILNAASIRWKYVKKLAFAGSNSGLQVINATNNSFQYSDIDALKTNSLITEANRDKVWIYHTSGIKNNSVEFTNIVGELKCNDKIIATNTNGEVFASTDTDIIHLAPGEYILSYATKENLLDGYVWKNGYYQRILDKTIPTSNIIDQNYNPLSEYGQSGKAVAEAIKQAQLQASEGIGVGLMVEDKGEVFNNYSDNTALGKYSHAEGNKTSATGNYSHAEGTETQALGTDSHAQGFATVAAGEFSHASGYQTLAGHPYQSVCGYYNLNQEDTLFEIGNGTQEQGQNAFEVRKDGSAKLGSARENEPNAVVTADFMMKHIHPIGSIWIGGKDNSGEKIHPATLFGGTWELIDQNFANNHVAYNSNTDVDAFSGVIEDGEISVSAVLSGKTLRLRIGVTSGRIYSDTNFTIGKINLEKLGVTNLTYTYNYILSSTDYTTGANKGVVMTNLGHDGTLTHTEVILGEGSKQVQFVQNNTPYAYYIDVTAPILQNKMLDDFCDRFYWQRTA